MLLNALEVLGYRVVSSFNNEGDQNCVWTMRKDFPTPCPEPSDDDDEYIQFFFLLNFYLDTILMSSL